MRGRLMFLTGAAVGYVLGARAGRGRYEQIKTQADAVWSDPRVQEKVGQAQSFVADTASSAGSALADKAGAAGSALVDKAGSAGSALADKAGSTFSSSSNSSSPYAGGTSGQTSAHSTGTGTSGFGAPGHGTGDGNDGGKDLLTGEESGSDYAPHVTKYNSAE